MGERYWQTNLLGILEARQQQIIERQRQIVDYHLLRNFVFHELANSLIRAGQIRLGGPSAAKNPLFRFVASISSAVYDFDNLRVYEGEWFKEHGWVAKKARVHKSQILSCDIFSLRAIPGVKVLLFHDAKIINSSHLRALYNAGYLPMDEYCQWIVFNPDNSEETSRLHSPITLSCAPK